MKHDGYYFNPKIAGFSVGSPFACLDGYQTELLSPARQTEKGLALAGRDLGRIFSMLPCSVSAPVWEPERFYPLCDAFSPYGCQIDCVEDTTQLLLTSDASILPAAQIHTAITQKKGQPGDYRGLYWHTGMHRYAPYHVYLPKSYDPTRKNPLILGLHGGGGSPDSIFVNSGDKIKVFAEQGGYILIAPDGSTINSTYGCAISPNGMVGAHWDKSHPENPEGLNSEELHSVAMGEVGLDLVLALAQKEYAADPGRLYLMGNSMGGMGTLYYASRHPGVFRRICAQGAIPNMQFFDPSGLKDQPTLFVAGECDSHGVEHLRQGVQELKEAGVPVVYREVPGGTHSSAWVDVLDEIFAFFHP